MLSMQWINLKIGIVVLAIMFGDHLILLMFTLIDIIFGMTGHLIILIIGDLVVGITHGDIIGIDLIIGDITGIMVLGITQVIM